MRRLARPILLIALALALVAAAVAVEGDDPARAAATADAPAVAVLSARRVPFVLLRPGGDERAHVGLRSLLDQSPPDTCLVVREGPRTILSHGAERALSPASNQKLLTAYAALAGLGDDTTLETSVGAPAAPVDGVVSGDLYLVGGGDPVLTTAEFQGGFDAPPAHTDLAAIAEKVADSGVKTVTGAVVGVANRYDAARKVEGWPVRDVGLTTPGALSALAVNRGYTSFTTDPDDTVIPQPTTDPAGDAARQFRDLLEGSGVEVQGGSRAQDPGSGPPAGTVTLVRVPSPPVSAIVETMLTQSDNTIAELLTKELGVKREHEGTTAAGTAAIAAILREGGIPTRGLVVGDGSGLDDDDRVSCATIAAVLEASGEDSAIGAGLPVAGKTGTLAERFVDTPAEGRLRAKTGSLDEATALSGFVDTIVGPVLTFAYVVNAPEVTDETVALQDLLASVLVPYPEGPPPDEIAP